jgi:thiamine biosynthesis protein ThiS
MKVTVNFEEEEFPEAALSVSEILRRRRYTYTHIITRINGKLVTREERDSALVREGDDLEIYNLISGG